MISLGFSPCPNDTFIFYALANKKIDTRGLDFDFTIEDVESLNQLALKKSLDVTKISCHAFYHLKDEYEFLGTGAALGRGCGPLLVRKSEVRSQKSEIKKIAIPGELTTAFLLLKLYLASVDSSHPNPPSPPLSKGGFELSFIPMPFHKIMESVRDGAADAGLIIHEGRFTYHGYGLSKIIDLGEWWERETGLPLPLGGVIARKSLGNPVIKTIENLIRTSVNYSLSHRDEAMPYIKKYSQELSERVINEHIALYVNNHTVDIGEEGLAALNELLSRADNTYCCKPR